MFGCNAKDGGDGWAADVDVHDASLSNELEIVQKNTPKIHTCVLSSAANAHPSCAVKVDFPTPPFPDRIRILRLTLDMRCLINGNDGSGNFVAPDAHIDWFSQPAQASDLPASSDSVPYMKSGQKQVKGSIFTSVQDSALVHFEVSTLDQVLQLGIEQLSWWKKVKMIKPARIATPA